MMRTSISRLPISRALLTTSRRTYASAPVEAAKNAASKANRVAGDAALKGIETGEAAVNAVKGAVGTASNKAQEATGYTKGDAEELAGQAKGKAHELTGEAKGKAAELKGEAKAKMS